MKLTEIAFKKLYAQITFYLKKVYNRANSTYSIASPFGQILSTLTQLFQLNTTQVQAVQKSFDLNEPLNQNLKAIRAITKVGQYNPARGTSASGTIKLQLKTGTNIEEDIKGGKIVFKNKQRLKNIKNNLEYVLDLNQDTITYTLANDNVIILNVVQGKWDNQTFTGIGELNQSFVATTSGNTEIDNYRFKLYYNSELCTPKKHKFDLLPYEKAYVPLTSFSGGVDLMFGNGDEGFIPALDSIIDFWYILTDGQNGNIVDPELNDFKFIELPTDFYGNDVDTEQFFDIDVNTNITFGTNAESAEYLKSILPYVSSNFVLSSVDQYKFFLKRLGLFSTIDVFTNKKNNYQLSIELFNLLKKNTQLLTTYNNNANTSAVKKLIQNNLNEIILLRKSILTEGGENLINIFLIPDIRIFYGSNNNVNYFNINTDHFLLTADEKKRILNYLSIEGTQVITNEIKIIDPIITKYVINVTTRIYDDAVEDNVINNITEIISNYFISNLRRDRIPPSDLIREIDGINDVDSVDISFVSELNENYHKEALQKSEKYKKNNGKTPQDNEIIMNKGGAYDRNLTIGLDPILGDILIANNELPIIRGGFSDRYNNTYNITPSVGKYSAVNILILPEKTRRKKLV